MRRGSAALPTRYADGMASTIRKSPRAEAESPAAQLASLISKFNAKEQKLIRAVRSAMRKWLPAAHELVYDYKTFFVITYSPTEKPYDGIVSIAARPDGVRLYF